MTTTCQEIYVRAKRFSMANAELAPSRQEILTRIHSEQQAIFSLLAAQTRDRYQTTAAVSSSNGSANRTIDISGITPSVLRVLKLMNAGGVEVNQVDVLDVEADFAPRYFVRGLTLVEVGSDWGTAGVVAFTLIYVYGATAITPTGAYSQTITIPDEWADLLVIPLAMYLFQIAGPGAANGGGRDSDEYKRLQAMLDERQAAFREYLKNYGGIEVRRFMLPTTSDNRQN